MSKPSVGGVANGNDTLRRCLVCGNHKGHREEYRKNHYPILRCLGCGVGSTGVASGFDAGAIYDETYFTGGHSDGYANYPRSEPVLRAEFRKVVQVLKRFVPPGGQLLELGSAYGFFLLEAARYYDVTGIEVCPEAAAAARRRGLNVVHGVLERDWLAAQPAFNAVVMLDVIEHLPDPEQTLTCVRDGLAPGGCVLITTGDWSSLLSRVMGKSWRLMTPPQHLFFFTRGSLTGMLKRLGFEVVRCEYPWKLVPLGLTLYQVFSRIGLGWSRFSMLNRVGVPVNLFDAMRIVARRRP
jgi:SAM-dependent methyltransferase